LVFLGFTGNVTSLGAPYQTGPGIQFNVGLSLTAPLNATFIVDLEISFQQTVATNVGCHFNQVQVNIFTNGKRDVETTYYYTTQVNVKQNFGSKITLGLPLFFAAIFLTVIFG